MRRSEPANAADAGVLAGWKAFGITTEDRPERGAHLVAELRRLPCDATMRVSRRPEDAGGFSSPGARGCFESHLANLRQAREEQVEVAVLVEDDAVFVRDIGTIMERLVRELAGRPWSVLLLGYEGAQSPISESPLRLVTPHVAAADGWEVIGTHFIAVHGDTLDDVIGYFEQRQLPGGHRISVDGIFNEFRRDRGHDTLVCIPNLARQGPSPSGITASNGIRSRLLASAAIRIPVLWAKRLKWNAVARVPPRLHCAAWNIRAGTVRLRSEGLRVMIPGWAAPESSRDLWLLRWMKWTFRPRHARRTWRVWRAVHTGVIDVEPRRSVRAWNAVRSIVKRPPPNGPVWAVSTVKNEADIIEETICNLFDQGVDHVMVADNGSTDGTVEVLHQLAECYPVHVLVDPIVEFCQGEKMSHLARAATRHGAAWIVPFDGDELWKGSGGRTVAEILRVTQANISVASWWDFMPVPVADAGPYAVRYPYRDVAPRPQVKSAFRANWPARIWIGSHHVTPLARPTEGNGLRVAHFQFRSPAQMVRKATDGARASRLARESAADLPQWFELDGAAEDDAATKLQRLLESTSLVFDPATTW
jgi:GR25 family glycosyltransferase involved in LPS biosynthesis